MAEIKVIICDDERTGRLKARTIGLQQLAQKAAEIAIEKKRTIFRAVHGGTVCNTYGYPAETECAVAVALYSDTEIKVAVYAAQIPANKTTLSGVARACLPVAVPVFDHRYGDGKTQAARKAAIEEVTAHVAHLEAN